MQQLRPSSQSSHSSYRYNRVALSRIRVLRTEFIFMNGISLGSIIGIKHVFQSLWVECLLGKNCESMGGGGELKFELDTDARLKVLTTTL